jgi:hypothetical protein
MNDEDLKNDAGGHESVPERGYDRSDRTELSGGRRDRSREMLREELERNLDDTSRRSGRPRDWEPADRPAREAREAAAPKAMDRDRSTSADGAAAPGTGAGAAPDTSSPPTAWTVDAKREWGRLPPAVQAAVAKREIDSARGVEELKNRYAEIDQALAPHLQTIRNAGHTAGRAVTQLFAWHQAIQSNPVQAMDALAKAHGYDLMAIAQAARGGVQQQQTNGQQQGFDPRTIMQYVDQRLGALTAQQQEQTVNAVIADFAKGREHFERLRGKMAALLQGGAIPLLPDGRVDLASAYDAALKLEPELFEQAVAERIAAEKKKQRDYADRARRAGSSLGGAAPGGNNWLGGAKKRTGGKSVRESISEALEEAAGR